MADSAVFRVFLFWQSKYYEKTWEKSLSFRQNLDRLYDTILASLRRRKKDGKGVIMYTLKGLCLCVACHKSGNKESSAEMRTDMANQGMKNGKEKKEYCFNKLPENIRQMGEPPENNRIYIEDYVVTYIHQVFQKKQEKAIVVLLGKKGENKAKEGRFIYGAVEIELDVLAGNQEFTEETWDKIHELVYEHFTGAQVLGWGCGVSMWNSQVDDMVRSIQQKHFAQEGKILFLEDLNEKEEKIFCWREGKLAELSGYVIYYEKNPLMQDYMLLGQPKRSFEAAYDDKVTATVRAVVQKNEELKNPKKIAAYSAGILLILLTILGANLLIQSTKKIDSLEKTIATLSNAAITMTAEPQKKSEGNLAATSKEDDGTKSIQETIKDSDDTKETAKKSEDSNDTKNTAEPPESTGGVQSTAGPEKSSNNTKSTAKPGEGKDSKESTPAKSSSDSTQSPKSTKTPVSEKKKTTDVKTTLDKQAVKVAAASYVVRSGDTLSQIVLRQYNTLACLEMVKKANHIKNGDKIKEGQRLILPAYYKG